VAALHGEPVLVPDILKDHRYRGNIDPGNNPNRLELALLLMIVR
jgi:hypothetical protein